MANGSVTWEQIGEPPQDLGPSYVEKSTRDQKSQDSQQMEEFMRTFDQGGVPASSHSAPDGKQLPPATPQRRPTDDQLGRQPVHEESTAGTIMRNVAEVVPSAVKGVNEAVMNATSFISPLSDWLNANVADLTFKYEQPETTTGAVVKSAAQFLTGFIPALNGLKAIGVAGKAATPISAGAIADFATKDPHEGRLSDLWNKAGLPQNILTDYLSSKSDDSEIEARFKNAIEGAGLGGMAEGVFAGARALRASRKVKEVKQTEDTYLKAKYGEVTDEQMAHAVGDPSKPMFEVVPKKASDIPVKIGRGVEDTAKFEPESVVRGNKKVTVSGEDFGTYINFSRIDSTEQIKFAMGKMTDAAKGTIDEAKRGVITQAETQKMADELGMSATDLLARRKGQGFNAEEAVAARQLWAASGNRLVEAAKKAASADASPLDQYAFRKMMATHAAIQSEVIGARTETARALASWAIPAGGNMEKARAIDQIMGAMGGPEASQEMARRLAILAETGASPAAIARFAERGMGATSMDALREVWINGLLSSPKTHAVNIMSNTLVAFQQIYERAAARGISAITGSDAVAAGESAAMAFGAIESIKDAFRMSALALKTGQSGHSINKIDIARPNSMSSDAFNISRETGLGRFVDFMGHAATVPGHLLAAEDEFFKTIGYRMELRAQALRTASQEGHKGPDLAMRTQELIDNPTEALRINSADAALYSTFSNELGKFGQAMMNLRNVDSALNPLVFVLPFVRTPANIARYTFERTPFAPLVGQWRADIAAGGARADLALARMSTGTAIMTTAMDYADSGLVSGAGPKDPAQREALMRQGWQPYSFKSGDRWVSYNRADPFGTTMGFAASINEAVRHGEIDNEDVDEWQEVMAMSIASVSQVTINKTYLEGFAKFVEVMSDPKRYSERYVDDLVASFVPLTALSSSVKNIVDPTQREAGSPMEAVQARIAFLSEQLPPRRSLWGEEIRAESGLGKVYDAMSPMASRPMVDSPIDKEMTRLEHGVQRIGKKTVIDGVQVNLKKYPQIYDEYARLSGNDLKHPAWGMGAKDYLNAVVSGKHPMSAAFNIMSDESRKAFIESTIGDYRKLAARQILDNPANAAFAVEVGRLKELHRNMKMPVLGE
jgi:hypothetical protein